MKKKILATIITSVMCIGLLAACGGEKLESPIIATLEPEPLYSTESSDNVQEGQDTEDTQTEQQTPAEEEVPPENCYRSELTNEWIDVYLQNQRPVAIMVDNESIALPHYGLTEADVVYELMNSTENNRITRFMAVVKDWEKIKQFGSIRSVRPTNIMLAAEWNAVLVHDGGPFYVDDWLARDYSANLSGGFARIDNGKSREFTEYVTEGELTSRFKSKGYGYEYNEYYNGPHYKFSNTEFNLSDTYNVLSCNEIKLPFPHNRSTLTYNAETGTYDYSEYGAKHLDPLHDNAQLTFKNVILQDTTFAQLDSNGYLIYNAMDVGRGGYYITNGEAIEITWAKKGENAITVYYNAATGEEIQLNTGKTYVALVPSDGWSDLIIR